MRSSFVPRVIAAVAFATSAFACSDGNNNGPPDSGEPVDAIDDFDAGLPADARPDAGRIDGGHRDIGFDDPATILQGIETIEGLDTFIHMQGTLTSTKPPVFLLQGVLDLGHEYLEPHMRFLLEGRLLVYYDMRASGRSDFGSSATTSTVTAEQHTIDLEDLRVFIGSRGANVSKIDLVGHGYGAAIGALYSAAHPEHVAHLVMTNPFPVTAHQLALFRAEASARVTSTELTFVHQLENSPECRADRGQCELDIWNVEGVHYLCDANRSLWRNLLFEYGSPRAEEYVEFDLRSKTYDWGPILETITVPTTIIGGVCDPTPAETVQTYTASVATSTVHVLQNSGFFPMVEEPDEYHRLVLEALRR